MTPFEALAPQMDATVDSVLGDTITYVVGETGSPRVITGFLRRDGDDGGADGVDRFGRWYVKVTKAQLPPVGPSRRDRLTSPRLAGPYRPAVDTTTGDNAYWLFEIQPAAEG